MPAPLRSPLDLGRALRDVRRRAGLTQRALAERAGIAQATVSNLERGVGSIPFQTLLRVLAALELDVALQDRRTGPAHAPWGEDL